MNNQEALKELREQLKKYIEANYNSVEDFCWDRQISKATISNFLNSKKDFQVSTLLKIAKGMKKKLKISVDY
ncbi:MAG: hypothetical protein OXB86_00705 [Bdellovibrionales bacterium]|nr:hypothetical protein [Bdellovibrionales bacterium]